jgi:hypothetical protein
MKLKAGVAIFALLFTTASLGKDRVTLEETISVEAQSTIHFDIPVGSLEITTYDGDKVILEVEVKEADSDWFSSVDLDDVEIDITQSGTKLHLEIEKEDVVQKWEVKIPSDASLNIDLGVGEVDIDDFDRDANIDVGVGEVDVYLSGTNYREIELDSGVGGADLDGFSNIDRERAMVSESIEWTGKGDYDLIIDVGVGDIDVRG